MAVLVCVWMHVAVTLCLGGFTPIGAVEVLGDFDLAAGPHV